MEEKRWESCNAEALLEEFFSQDDLRQLALSTGELLGCPLLVLDDTFHIAAHHLPLGFSDALFETAVRRGEISYEAGAIISRNPMLTAGWADYVQLADSPYRRRFAPLVSAGVRGGMSAAPQIVGLNDTILRTLRDEPGYWWETYRRTWKRNLKESLLPGAVCGLLLAMEIFSLCHINIAGGQVAVIAVLVAIILLAGIAQYLYVQVALLDLSFAGLLKNSLMLFLGYLPRSGLGLLWQLLYWGAVALFWPISSFVLILTSLWLPCLLSLMAIYPALEKSFDIEKKIKAIREAQLHGDDDQ